MKELIFVVDPMCSWSWGFQPVMEKLRSEYTNVYQFSLLLGGLRTTGDMLWNDTSRAYLKSNWDAIAQRTFQPFSDQILERPSFDYNTYPSCKAVLTVRELWGRDAAFAYLASIQKAFYAQGDDITAVDVLVKYVMQEKELFLAYYHSDRAQLLMEHDFSRARAMGADAFPSMVIIDEAGHMVCLKGYKSFEECVRLL